MPPNDYMSEDYVTELLKRDAKESSKKYSLIGVEALMPKRPTSRAPKPNTKFLQNIIRDTNSHNAALRAREEEEAAARLSRIRGHNQHDYGRLSQYKGRDHEHREKRRRLEESDKEELKLEHRRRSRSPIRISRSWDRVMPDRDDVEYSRHYHRRRRGLDNTSSADEDHNRRRDRGHDKIRRDWNYSSREHDDNGNKGKRGKQRSRSRSAERAHKKTRNDLGKDRRDKLRGMDISKAFDSAKRRRHQRSRSGSRSRSPSRSRPQRDRSHSREGRDGHDYHDKTQSRPRSHRTKENLKPDASGNKSSASDSDPIESIIKPLPPDTSSQVRPRGRGAMKRSSGIDARFSSAYDPAADVQPNSASEDDWDQALEALQDRQKWKQQGAERLRAAGFTDKEISTWEKGGTKNEDDVRWTKPGEGREWDRGKIITADGAVTTAPDWGRLSTV